MFNIVTRAGTDMNGLTNDQMARIAPAIFAEQAHVSRSARYQYVSTLQMVEGMRAEGFMPVNAQLVKSRDAGQQGHAKHMIRFRRADQLMLDAGEAREVVIVNSHNGTSSFNMFAGVFRFICANGLICGSKDSEVRVHHTGNALHNVIEGAYSIVKDFDKVTGQIEGMKGTYLNAPQSLAFARSALALRYDDVANCGVQPEQLLTVRRSEDKDATLWNTFNVVQEKMIKGGVRSWKRNANNQIRRGKTRTINGIDQNVAINRGLWTLAEEMRKLVAA